MCCDFALHHAPSVEIPFGEQFAIFVDVDVTGVMVANP